MEPRNSIDVEFHSSEVAVVVLHGEHDLDSIDQLALALAGGGAQRSGVVIRAQVSDAWNTETPPRRRAA